MAVSVGGGFYNVQTYDSLVEVSTGVGPAYINLPSATAVADGFSVTVLDSGSNAQVNNITVKTNDGSLINSAAVFTISVNGGSGTFTKVGTAWSAASSFAPNLLGQPIYNTTQISTSGSYTLKTSDDFVTFNAAGTMAVTLPATTASSLVLGREVVLMDASGNANATANAIWLVAGNASTSINGGAGSLTISSGFGRLRLMANSKGWWQVG